MTKWQKRWAFGLVIWAAVLTGWAAYLLMRSE